MSCTDCEEAQDIRVQEYYFRVDNGNVLIFGCAKHVGQLMDKARGHPIAGGPYAVVADK